MQEQETKLSLPKVNTKVNKKQIKALKKWSLTAFAVTLLITSMFVFNAFAQTGTTDSTILNLTNNTRSKDNLKPLSENETLKKAAYAKAQDMFKNQYFEHTSPAGKTPWEFINKAGYDYAYAGENLAIDFDNIETTHIAWMGSPAHKANILNPNYSEIGVASVSGLYNGKTTIITVEMFGTSMFDTTLNNLRIKW